MRPDFFHESRADESEEGRLDALLADPHSVVLGAFGAGDELLGVASVSRRTHARSRHRATLHHVHAANRSEVITASLVDAAITWAERLGGVRQLEVKVVMDDFRLLGAARRAGFAYCGTVPDAVQMDGCFYDQWLLFHRLAGPKAG
jgi:GNAT superfamily N-acetyltransferase